MPVVSDNDDRLRSGKVSPDARFDMENEIEGTRWVIPRPSLAPSVSGSESSSKMSRGLPTKSRSSASSQGSNSNHSTHSASSGSLLLSAANLSKINELHTSSRQSHSDKVNNYQNNLSTYVHSSGTLLANNEKYPPEDRIDIENNADPFWTNVTLASAKNQRKDTEDTESVASSTHFTVVNGFTRHGKNIKNDSQMWCCKSSHQITVLIVTMTVLFTAGLLAAICYVEMRQRRDEWSRYS